MIETGLLFELATHIGIAGIPAAHASPWWIYLDSAIWALYSGVCFLPRIIWRLSLVPTKMKLPSSDVGLLVGFVVLSAGGLARYLGWEGVLASQFAVATMLIAYDGRNTRMAQARLLKSGPNRQNFLGKFLFLSHGVWAPRSCGYATASPVTADHLIFLSDFDTYIFFRRKFVPKFIFKFVIRLALFRNTMSRGVARRIETRKHKLPADDALTQDVLAIAHPHHFRVRLEPQPLFCTGHVMVDGLTLEYIRNSEWQDDNGVMDEVVKRILDGFDHTISFIVR